MRLTTKILSQKVNELLLMNGLGKYSTEPNHINRLYPQWQDMEAGAALMIIQCYSKDQLYPLNIYTFHLIKQMKKILKKGGTLSFYKGKHEFELWAINKKP